MFQWHVIWAVLRRNVESYFSGALGYLVVVLFVTVGAFCAFGPQFFGNNLANLDQLSNLYPLLLLAVVPAITMASWADERKLGTDEILFTLPAADVEILIGKYVAALAVYSIALLFSVTQLFVLAWIGDPDWGVVFTTYVGYWWAGAALISVGMFASVLTNSTTVAYVLGVALCAIPVSIGSVAPGNALFQTLSLSSQLRDFTVGLIPLSGLLYFGAFTAFMLYLNMIFISRRHWAGNEQAAMGTHFSVRAIALAAALISVNFMANETSAYFVARLDATSESLYTLSSTTRQTIRNASKNKRTVTIQAFMSAEVPQQFVHVRKQFDGLLRQYDRIGGSTVDVRFVNIKSNSTKAKKEARTLGIDPIRQRSEVAGKVVEQDVYMGAVVTSSLGEVVLEFLDGNTSLEYELTRSIATVTSRLERRLKIGVLETDGLRIGEENSPVALRFFFEEILAELEKQYDIENVTRSKLTELVQADNEKEERQEKQAEEFGKLDKNSDKKLSEKEFVAKKDDAKEAKREFGDKDENDDGELSLDEFSAEEEAHPDVLLVVQASSLTSKTMQDLVDYIKNGRGTLVLDDPVPFYPYVCIRPGTSASPTHHRKSGPAPNRVFRGSPMSSKPRSILDTSRRSVVSISKWHKWVRSSRSK